MNEKSMIRDLTQGSVTRLLLIFSFPLLLSNLLQTVYNMVDMVVIGQFVGKAGLSAVSIGGDVMHLTLFLAMGFANAGQVLLSQYIGAGNHKRVRGTIGTMFTLILGAALVLTVFGVFFLNTFLHLMNTPQECYKETWDYAITCILGMVFMYGYNLVSAILRGMGDSKRPFLFIAVATIVNLILDLVFVALFKLGPFGAALATVIGQAVSFIWAIIYLYRRRESFGFDFRPESFRIDREVLPRLIKLGLPMCLQSAAISISMLFVNSYINSYGVVAVAVTGVGNRLGAITAVVTNALSTAGSSMVGQNIGAEKYDRVPRIIGVSFAIDMAFALLLILMLLVFGRQIIAQTAQVFPRIHHIFVMIMSMRLLIMFVILNLFFIFVYMLLPNRKTKFTHVLPGSLVCSLGWIITSYIFAYLFHYTTNFSYMYGSLAGIMMIMLLLYWYMYQLFLGAEFNLFLYPEDSGLKPEQRRNIFR